MQSKQDIVHVPYADHCIMRRPERAYVTFGEVVKREFSQVMPHCTDLQVLCVHCKYTVQWRNLA